MLGNAHYIPMQSMNPAYQDLVGFALGDCKHDPIGEHGQVLGGVQDHQNAVHLRGQGKRGSGLPDQRHYIESIKNPVDKDRNSASGVPGGVDKTR